jgi:hypothetical protein
VITVVEKRDVKRLAELASEGFKQERSAEWRQDAREDRS